MCASMADRVPFVLCFEAHRPDGAVWAVLREAEPREDGPWEFFAAVDMQVPAMTVYRGPQAAQPRAYLMGEASRFEIAWPGTILTIK